LLDRHKKIGWPIDHFQEYRYTENPLTDLEVYCDAEHLLQDFVSDVKVYILLIIRDGVIVREQNIYDISLTYISPICEKFK
ncbi:hypothetical protein FO601_35370, partial [Bacillus thuringiensis]|nr:hypothetical protein [Bacillus thuringiensis]